MTMPLRMTSSPGWLIVLGLFLLGASVPSHAREIVVLYGGTKGAAVTPRTIKEHAKQNKDDQIVSIVYLDEMPARYSAIIVASYDDVIVDRCRDGSPPNMGKLERDIQEYERDVNYKSQIRAYSESIDMLQCAGGAVSASEMLSMYMRRAMVFFAQGNTESARKDFVRALTLDPALVWDETLSPKAHTLFEDAKETVDSEDVFAIHVIGGALSGASILLDGQAMATAESTYSVAGDHYLAWGEDSRKKSAILRLRDSLTLVDSSGFEEVLFRSQHESSRLMSKVLYEIALWEDLDDVVVVDSLVVDTPVTSTKSSKRREFGKLRTGIRLGYSRFSHFDYLAFHAELWIRLSGLVYLNLELGNRLTRTFDYVNVDSEAPERVDAALPSAGIGMQFHPRLLLNKASKNVGIYPRGGFGVRFNFTGPSLIVFPTIVVQGGLDIRPWYSPVYIGMNALGGVILATSDNDSLGRNLNDDHGRGVFEITACVGIWK